MRGFILISGITIDVSYENIIFNYVSFARISIIANYLIHGWHSNTTDMKNT